MLLTRTVPSNPDTDYNLSDDTILYIPETELDSDSDCTKLDSDCTKLDSDCTKLDSDCTKLDSDYTKLDSDTTPLLVRPDRQQRLQPTTTKRLRLRRNDRPNRQNYDETSHLYGYRLILNNDLNQATYTNAPPTPHVSIKYALYLHVHCT